MKRIFVGGTTVFAVLGATLASAAGLPEGRSVRICSDQAVVCAFMKDGSSSPTSECRAKSSGAVRIVPGECDDAD